MLLTVRLSIRPSVRHTGKSVNQTVNDGVAHSKNPRKCGYHVTSDLDLDLENTLYACLPGDHRVQVRSRVKRPLSVNQHGQLSQPSPRGRLNESSNPLMMVYLLLAGAACGRLLGHCAGLCLQTVR